MDFNEGNSVIYKQAKFALKKSDRYLGINCCAVCARKEKKEAKDQGVECLGCAKIWYCSEKCLNIDTGRNGGHSDAICKLLKQCAEDDLNETKGDRSVASEARIHSEIASYSRTLCQQLIQWTNMISCHVIGASAAELAAIDAFSHESGFPSQVHFFFFYV